MKFTAPLALAAVAVAAPVADAEAEAVAVAEPHWHRFQYPSYGCPNDLANTLDKLAGYCRGHQGGFAPHVPLIGIHLNAFIAGLLGVGLDINVL